MQVWSLYWEDLLEKEMATHSGILAWRIPWTEEPGGLQSIGPQRVCHDCSYLACKVRSTPLPLIFRVPLRHEPPYILYLHHDPIYYFPCWKPSVSLQGIGWIFLFGCNLCDKLAIFSSDFWAGHLGNDPSASFLSSLFLPLSSREEKTWQTLLQLGDQVKYQCDKSCW